MKRVLTRKQKLLQLRDWFRSRFHPFHLVGWRLPSYHPYHVTWWLLHRLHPQHQYHVIRTTLRPGYNDPCMRLESAILDTTQKFLEETEGLIGWDWCEGHTEAHTAFREAAAFWKEHRNSIQGGLLHGEEEEQVQAQANAHMLAVIKHLGYMWYP